jgi:general secretion pathway protein D
VETTIRQMVAGDRYEEARQLLVRADQIVEAGRQFANPLSVYESLRAEANALAELVEEAERNFNERRVAEVRRQIEEQRAERIRQDEENRREQVEKLMEQACQHKDDGDLDGAIVVLNQVVVIDPQYKPARWMIDNLEELRANKLGRQLRDDLYKESRDSLNLVEEAKIPWSDLLRYPKNWPEIIARPERGGSGMSVRTSSFLSALESPVPVQFDRDPLEQAIERLAASQNLNVIVKWHDLQRVGVAADTPITLKVPNEISLKRALTEVLDQAGAGGATIGFEITDEAIVIATQDTLDRNTHQVVYDINDLLMEIPHFNDAPVPDLADTTRKNVQQPEPALPPNWNQQDVFDDAGDPMDSDRRQRVAEIIQLIQDNVAPQSWRDRGGNVGHISEINGQLVITQNSSAQRAIGDLLGKLREQRAIQIAVEARFITVSSHFLEELGMDLDIVLNSGNAGFDYIPGPNGPVTDPVHGSALLLPRSFSRMGFTPGTPNLGVPNTTNPASGSIFQPYDQPYLVPQRGGGGGSQATPIPISNQITQITGTRPSDVPGTLGGLQAAGLSIFGSFLDNIQVDFLIRATQADSRTTVLTAPQLVLFNGQRSWVAVTLQQNFVSQLNPVVATGAVAQAPVIGTIDSGAVLDVNATVTADKRYVTMTLRPGVTRLLALAKEEFSGGTAGGLGLAGAATTAFIQLPLLSSQRVQTTVSVPDGGTLLIGGQKIAAETEIEAGVPILSKIPILKRAYNSRSMVKDEQTLLILIKPKILIQSEQEEEAFPTFAAPP